MKRLIISMLLIVFFSSAFALGSNAESAVDVQQTTQLEEPAQEADVDANAVVDVNAVVDANTVVDANVAEEEIEPEWIGKLKRALEKIDNRARKETREWLRGTVSERLDLAKTVQNQTAAELNFIRKFAVEEEAVKTTEAIDRLLANRDGRFEIIIRKMEKVAKVVSEREASRQRRQGRGRSNRSNGQRRREQ